MAVSADRTRHLSDDLLGGCADLDTRAPADEQLGNLRMAHCTAGWAYHGRYATPFARQTIQATVNTEGAKIAKALRSKVCTPCRPPWIQ